jgi:hypothetical protein
MVQESTRTNGWWYVRFRIKWPESAKPSWHVDLLIANEIIAAVLKQYKDRIILWRFHRRAFRDDEGHQFSLTFYSSPETAKEIFKTLQYDRLLKKLKRSGVVIRDIYDDTSKILAPNIQDTSDGHWTAAIRKSWPYYISGISELWLHLISDIVETPEKENLKSLPALMKFYSKANERVNSLWREEGNHAFLHHLNAVFGYEPLLVREVHLKRF